MTNRNPTTDRPRRDDAPSPPPVGGGDRPVTLAAIVGAHGIAGEVRLKLFAEAIEAFTKFNRGTLTLRSLRDGPNGAIARFAEVRDRNAAEALRGTELTVPRSALPPLGEGEYYHVDLIGLAACTMAGERIGIVAMVENFGAGDVIEIEREDGTRFMVPMRPEAVPEWDGARLIVADGWADA